MSSLCVIQPKNLTELQGYAEIIAKSSFCPSSMRGKPGDILVACQMGAEVGLSPIQAIQNIAVINGKPSIWGDAALALVQSHPACEDIVESFDEKTITATCTVRRKGRSSITRTFSQADAEKAGLWGKSGPWKQYTKRMLQMRARGFAVRDSFPDALKGLITAEEARDYPTVETTATIPETSYMEPIKAPEAVEVELEEESEPLEPPVNFIGEAESEKEFGNMEGIIKEVFPEAKEMMSEGDVETYFKIIRKHKMGKKFVTDHVKAFGYDDFADIPKMEAVDFMQGMVDNWKAKKGGK